MPINPHWKCPENIPFANISTSQFVRELLLFLKSFMVTFYRPVPLDGILFGVIVFIDKIEKNSHPSKTETFIPYRKSLYLLKFKFFFHRYHIVFLICIYILS